MFQIFVTISYVFRLLGDGPYARMEFSKTKAKYVAYVYVDFCIDHRRDFGTFRLERVNELGVYRVRFGSRRVACFVYSGFAWVFYPRV